LGLGHLGHTFGLFFVMVYIVRVVIKLMAKYHWIFRVMLYDLMYRNLVHIFQSLRFIL